MSSRRLIQLKYPLERHQQRDVVGLDDARREIGGARNVRLAHDLGEDLRARLEDAVGLSRAACRRGRYVTRSAAHRPFCEVVVPEREQPMASAGRSPRRRGTSSRAPRRADRAGFSGMTAGSASRARARSRTCPSRSPTTTARAFGAGAASAGRGPRWSRRKSSTQSGGPMRCRLPRALAGSRAPLGMAAWLRAGEADGQNVYAPRSRGPSFRRAA